MYIFQDEIGQYNYGYNSADQSKNEVKTADGVVRGTYSYVDANGLVQTTNYISDALGFRVAATNLPVHDVNGPVAPVQVAVSPLATAAAVEEAAPVVSAAAAPVVVPQVSYAYLPYASNYGYHAVPTQYIQAAPAIQAVQVVQAAPAVETAYASQHAAAIPIIQSETAPISSQYHAQDEFGQYSFGYSDTGSVRQESKTADGVVTGGYRYVDGNGLIQTVEYIADDAGFRVAGTNLPIASGAGPEDTPEVAAAKIQHAQAYAAVKAAAGEEEYIPEATPLAVPVVYADPAVQAAPVAYATPAVQAASVVYNVAPAVQATPVSYATPAVQAASVVYNVAPAVQAAPVAYATPDVQAASVVYNAAPAASPVQIADASSSQFHAQDEFGQYNYGYSDENSVKQELKTADGVVRGSYSYVDSDGLLQTVNYIADALGFRVGATNLPVHVIDGASAPVAEAQPAVAVAYTGDEEQVASNVLSPLVQYAYLPYASNYDYNLPPSAPVQEAPVVSAAPIPIATVNNAAPVIVETTAPVADVNTQFHAQDELGQYNYGYSNPTQSKSEIKTADGITRGTYSYVDANGLIQTVNYISDAMGFRVAATNLPVHNVGVEAAPEAVEVAKYSALTPSVNYAYLPYAQNYAYNTAVTA